jgi:putative ABC transport system ATP-binding protein
MDTTAPAVHVKDLARVYGSGSAATRALDGVELTVEHGEFVAIMGPSGSGKSTLLHIVGALESPSGGHVEVAGRRLDGLSERQLTLLRRDHIGFIFQFFNLLPMLSAEENIVLPLEVGNRKVDRAWLDEIVDKVGLSKRRRHRPAELSGGEQQRVAIARALVLRPTVMFADEPTGNLDSRTSVEILHLLQDMVQTYGQTTVIVTHDPRAASIADRILFLADGQIERELGRSEPHDVIAAMEALSR